MEKLSRCCGLKRVVVDTWASHSPSEDVRFIAVCSGCGNDFSEREIDKEIEEAIRDSLNCKCPNCLPKKAKLNNCPTCHADLPKGHPLRKK